MTLFGIITVKTLLHTLIYHTSLFMESWKHVHDTTQGHGRSTGQSLHDGLWSPPPMGYLKVNIDAALDFEHRRTGIGWVVRTAEGVV